jgi:integrase
MAKWTNSKFSGVRYREHPSRKFGVRKDRYYSIRYLVDGKRIEEGLGWESEWKQSHPDGAISLEQHAVTSRAQLMKNKKTGTGPATLKEAREEAGDRREAVKAERDAKTRALKTLSEYWQESFFPVAQRSKKPMSWAKEESHFRLWIGPIMGDMPLKSIGLKQWDELVKTVSSAGLSPRTQQYITGTLRRILKHACDRRLIDEAPPSGNRIGVAGPGNNRRLRVISHEEEAAIMDELEICDPNAWRITRFAFLTGCRASEAFNLVWANVDSSQGTLIFTETKNRDPRTIPLTPPLAELFSSMDHGSLDERVFPKANGTPYTEAPSAFRTAVDKLRLNENRSKRDRVVFHSIRHSVATRLSVRLGPRDLMDVMGWRTVQMAMRYVHSNEDLKVKALSMLGTAPQTGKVLEFQARAQSAVNIH